MKISITIDCRDETVPEMIGSILTEGFANLKNPRFGENGYSSGMDYGFSLVELGLCIYEEYHKVYGKIDWLEKIIEEGGK